MINLFDIYIALITFCKGIGLSSNSKLYLCCFFLGVCFIILKLSKEKFSKDEILKLSIISFLAIINYFVGKNTTILFTVITLWGLKNVNISSVFRLVLKVRIFAFVLNIMLCLINLKDNKMFLMYRGNKFIVRYSLGFEHPNECHGAFLIIVILILYLYYEKIEYKKMIILQCFNWILYKITFCRTSFLIITLMIISVFFMKYVIKIFGFFLKIYRSSYMTCLILSIIIGLLFDKFSFINELDNILTGRIYYINLIFKNSFPPLIGNVSYNNIVNFDNGYITLLYEGGILITLWYSYYIIKLSNYFYIKNNYLELMMLAFFALYALTESFFPSISVNISLIFLSKLIFKNNNGSEKNE